MASMFNWAAAVVCLLAIGPAPRALAAPPPLEAYGNLPQVEFMTLSLSGDRYAYLSTTEDKRRIVIAPTGGGKVRIVNVDPTNKIRRIEWAGDDYILVTISATTGSGQLFVPDSIETTRVIVISAKTGANFAVFDGHSEMLPLVWGQYGFAQIEGRWYGYFGALAFSNSVSGSYLGHGYADLYRVDLETGATLHVVSGSQNMDVNWLVGPDGRVVASTNYFEKTGAWQLNEGRLGDLVVSGHSAVGGPVLVGMGKEPDTVLTYVRSNVQPGFRQISLMGDPDKSLVSGSEIEEPLFDRRTGLWMGDVLAGDTPKTVLFAADRQAKLNGVRKAFAQYNLSLVSWDADFSRLIVETEGGDDSGTYWLADMTKRSVESIGQAYPQVLAKDVGPVRMVTWKAADGLELHGVLTLPPGRSGHGLPVVVFPHGGPQARDYPGFDWWAQAFASRGYAVFQPNFRGSDGYGPAFVIAGHGEWGRKMQTDISDGLAALASQGIVDAKRACIVGASYGGYAALAGVTLQKGLYRCAVADAPISDLRSFLNSRDHDAGNTRNALMRYWYAFMGAGPDATSTLDALSPAKLADHADAPILLIHGKDDTVVPFGQSVEMRSALERAGKPVEMVVMPNEDHWLSRPETRLSMLSAAVAFVQKYNPAD